MNDKDKFLTEWRIKFPHEELPDTALFSSVNFMNIRSKISDCETRMKQLRTALQKEEFILNWLISQEIEISVLGNVGVSDDSMAERPNSIAIWDEGERLTDFQEFRKEETRNVPIDAEGLRMDMTQENTTQDITNITEEKGFVDTENIGNAEEGVVRPSFQGQNGSLNLMAQGVAVTVKENKGGREFDPAFEGATIVRNSIDCSPDERDHEYENIFDCLGRKQSVDQNSELESPTRKSRDNRRRAGGSWSVFIDDEDEEATEVSKKDDAAETVLVEANKPVNTDQETYDTPAVLPMKTSSKNDTSNANIYEEISFPNNMKDKNEAKSDNVTVNTIYESSQVMINRENINTQPQEREPEEVIYVNVQDLNIAPKLAPVARIEASDASDYDSDTGRNESEDNSPSYRHMTTDEINHLRKWRSDEDLSQYAQDFDDRSCDSDDSMGGRGRSCSQVSQGNNRIANEEEATDNHYENVVLKDSSDGNSQEDMHSDSQGDNEEDGEKKESQKMRNYLVKNLLDSEMSYFECLDMIRKYMKPLQKSTETSQPILTMQDFGKIFLGMEGLHALHDDLLQQLEKRVQSWDDNQTIGDIFTILMDGFGVYKDFINNYKSSQETLLKCRNANTFFDGIVQKEIKIHTLKDPIKLDALLYKPVDRMTQYSLILNDLLKYTPEDHPDHELLSEATANLFDLFEQINVNRRDKKAPQRQLLKEGNVVELVDGERKARTLFLMNDVLICAKLKPAKDAYVYKWYVSLNDIQLKPFKESEGTQTVPVTTKADCDKLRAVIANIRSEMRRDAMTFSQQPNVEGGSPFVRPKMRKQDSSTQIRGPRASTRGLERLKKKLQEQERLLQLIAPSIPLNIYHKSGKTYTLLIYNDDDKILWKEAIAPRIKRMISRKQGFVHLSHMEIQQALEISHRVQRLGQRFGAAIMPSPFIVDTRRLSKDEDADGLSGFLYIHVQSGKSFSKTAENYCLLEADSYGHFFRKGKTKAAKGSEPQWDEDFEFDVEAASQLRLTCYNNRGRLLGDELSGKVTIDLGKENLADCRSHAFTVVLDKQGAITVTISFSQTLQGITRTRTHGNETTKVFKASIASVTRREKFDIPLVVISCIKEIEKRGMDDVGIYRLSGIASEVKSLKSAFDENPQSAVFALAEADINAVAGLIKLYLRELPEPLFTNALYPRFVGGLQISDPEEKELYMTDMFQQLPKPNKLTAQYLFQHLKRVSAKESINKMGINNLSTVFGPTVLRPSVQETEKGPDSLRSGSTFDIGALDVMSQVSIFRFFLGLNSTKTRLPEEDLELWQRLDHQKAAEIQEKLMENAVEYLI